jgi:hypothetical protein
MFKTIRELSSVVCFPSSKFVSPTQVLINTGSLEISPFVTGAATSQANRSPVSQPVAGVTGLYYRREGGPFINVSTHMIFLL